MLHNVKLTLVICIISPVLVTLFGRSSNFFPRESKFSSPFIMYRFDERVGERICSRIRSRRGRDV